MKKISTMQVFGNEIFKEQKLTIGLDLGDRWSFYCVLDEAGKIILEQKVATTPEAMKQTSARTPSYGTRWFFWMIDFWLFRSSARTITPALPPRRHSRQRSCVSKYLPGPDRGRGKRPADLGQ